MRRNLFESKFLEFQQQPD